jgi:hypothetical protein
VLRVVYLEQETESVLRHRSGYGILFVVSTVAEIIEAVKNLPEAEKGEFLERLAEIDFDDAWDRQIEADVKAGRLDKLIAQAEADIAAGRTKPLDEVLGDR